MQYNGSIIQNITLDVSQFNPIAPILVKQKDAYTRGFKVTITDNGTALQIPNNAVVAFNCENQTDTSLITSVAGTVNSDGTVTVMVPQVVMQKSGYIQCDISITTENNNEAHVLKTMTFMLDCQKAANPDGTSTTAEDDILAGIAAGTIAPPGRKVTILDYATSSSMNFSIPTTYEGEIGDIVVMTLSDTNDSVGGSTWQCKGTSVVSGTTYYYWLEVADAADLEDKEDLVNKTNSITDSNKSSTTYYPSVKAVVDYVSPHRDDRLPPYHSFGYTDNHIPFDVNDRYLYKNDYDGIAILREYVLDSWGTQGSDYNYNWTPMNQIVASTSSAPPAQETTNSKFYTVNGKQYKAYSIPTYYIGDKLVDETAGKVYLCTNVVGDYNRTFDYTWVTFDLTT